ncbi:unnamed protein product [Staurois parvus]|uniref:Uncharacterized protein n=1 Tax=Staurois parvus TaxID=386267 RepID=A0ABN9G3X0_9NEOB|nr:unnamed protein product [Staurois parvus]
MENYTQYAGQEKWDWAESIQDRRSGTGQSPYILCRVENYTRHTGQEKWDCAESIPDKRSGAVQSPYQTREVVLCRVHTYRIRTDMEIYTWHIRQEKWCCAKPIHTE